MKSPLASVKDQFGDKKKLVEAVEKLTGEDLWLGRIGNDKTLAHVSNAKLLKLHATFTTVKEKFGTRVKLIDAIAAIEKRTKDEGYKSRLGAYPVPRLWDLYQTVEKRTARAAKSAKDAAAPKKAPAKKAAKAAVPATKAAPAKSAKK